MRELLHARGLPVTVAGASGASEILAATRLDKKRLAARVPFVLVDEPGECADRGARSQEQSCDAP